MTDVQNTLEECTTSVGKGECIRLSLSAMGRGLAAQTTATWAYPDGVGGYLSKIRAAQRAPRKAHTLNALGNLQVELKITAPSFLTLLLSVCQCRTLTLVLHDFMTSIAASLFDAHCDVIEALVRRKSHA